MNLFDIIIIVVTGFCLIRGLFRGIISELSSIIGVMGGFYAAYSYYPVLSAKIVELIGDSTYLNIISFALIFCGVFIIISLVGLVVRYILDIVFLGWVDRICGAVFGAFKGIMLVSLVLISFTLFLPKETDLIQKSVLLPYVTKVSDFMVTFASEDMKRKIGSGLEEFQ